MLDIFLYGSSKRLSPEAPVPIVLVDRQTLVLGGSANVAVNLRGIGCSCVLCGMTGNDINLQRIQALLTEKQIESRIGISSDCPTIVKNRVIADDQHVVRFDIEKHFSDENTVFSKIASVDRSSIDGIIISDYNKGTVTENVIDLMKTQFNCKIFLDPKPNHKNWYKDLFCITPNVNEAEQMSKYRSPRDIALDIKESLNLNCLVLTMSEKGVIFVDPENRIYEIPAYHLKVNERHHKIDVTGAGDTFISVFAASVVSGIDLLEAVVMSNIAAAVVVNKLGTSTCSDEELQNEMHAVPEIVQRIRNG